MLKILFPATSVSFTNLCSQSHIHQHIYHKYCESKNMTYIWSMETI